MSVRMRHTRSHTKNRRSHHKIVTPRLSLCGRCGTPHIRHRACAICGSYRGREVIDVTKKAVKKKEKKTREREQQ